MSSTTKASKREIEVWADWKKLGEPILMGVLTCIPSRGKEVFSFEYDENWLKSGNAQNLDPSLQLYSGPQFTPTDKDNFGMFLDSAPDKWGRLLMRRREGQEARKEGRKPNNLVVSDYLLGVYDLHRLGALRFKTDPEGLFLDENQAFASPPWTNLRDLEYASLQLERDGIEDDPKYGKWLQMLMAPGASLGGARPKASVLDPKGHLWIAKFPSRHDTEDKGAWEAVAHQLAINSGIIVSEAQAKVFTRKQHTFLTKRFDRTEDGQRIHFASAMTLLNRKDGDDASTGASYLELAEILQTSGANVNCDLEQLWRRIVFYICISNVDDHLRNHGFLLTPEGWVLSPSYDMNPSEFGNGLKLNISESENAQDVNLAIEVAEYFRLKKDKASDVAQEIINVVKTWPKVADQFKISETEKKRMAPAFSVVDEFS